jgi:hypothetical protein
MSGEIVKAQQASPAASLTEKIQYAQALAVSGMLPSQYRKQPANLLYALEYAESLGLHPMAAITGIHVIEGTPSASAGLISALVRRAGHKLRVQGDDRRAVAQIVRSDDPEFTFEAVWTLERAEQSGLVKIKDGRPFARSKKGEPLPWERFTAAMLKARAITEAARAACEEALSGLHYTPEEIGANVGADGEPVDAEVTQLRRVQPGEADPWATPTAAQTATPGGREYLREALDAPDAETVRQIYRDAAAEGAVPDYLAQIAAVGTQKAAAEQQPGEVVEDVDAGLTPYRGEHGYPEGESPEEQTRAAVAELHAFAKANELTDIAADFESATGIPLSEAGPGAIREFLAQLTGTAA